MLRRILPDPTFLHCPLNLELLSLTVFSYTALSYPNQSAAPTSFSGFLLKPVANSIFGPTFFWAIDLTSIQTPARYQAVQRLKFLEQLVVNGSGECLQTLTPWRSQVAFLSISLPVATCPAF